MLLAGAILLFYLLQASPPLSLIIENPGTKEVHYAIPCLPGDVFTLAYRHSVSKSMVYGTFALTQRGGIKPLTTSFSSFGPGLPWLDEGVEHTIADGKFTVQHDEEPREEIRLWVSPLTEDSISLNGVTYGLASLADEPVLLRIHVVRRRESGGRFSDSSYSLNNISIHAKDARQLEAIDWTSPLKVLHSRSFLAAIFCSLAFTT